jgi:hypothetical protein
MVFYLVTSVLLLPTEVPKWLAMLRLLPPLTTDTTPTWLFGYGMTVGIVLLLALTIAVVPLIYLCLRLGCGRLVCVPAMLLLAAVVTLFVTDIEPVSDGAFGLYTATALGFGIDWLVRRRRQRPASDG